MEGWSGSTRGARSWADLPAQAVKYVRRIEELVEAPVTLLSTSPERDDTILMGTRSRGDRGLTFGQPFDAKLPRPDQNGLPEWLLLLRQSETLIAGRYAVDPSHPVQERRRWAARLHGDRSAKPAMPAGRAGGGRYAGPRLSALQALDRTDREPDGAARPRRRAPSRQRAGLLRDCAPRPGRALSAGLEPWPGSGDARTGPAARGAGAGPRCRTPV